MIRRIVYGALIVAAMVALVFLYGVSRYREGWAEANSDRDRKESAALNIMHQRLAKARVEAQARINTLEKTITVQQEAYRDRIAKLKTKDTTFGDWYGVRVHPAAVELTRSVYDDLHKGRVLSH